MASFTFSPKSRQGLLDIGDYIAQDSRSNARRLVGKLIEQCRRIGRAPLSYVIREDLAPGLRMAALGRYVIFCRVLDGAVRIGRVLHGARNLPMLFGHTRRRVGFSCQRYNPAMEPSDESPALASTDGSPDEQRTHRELRGVFAGAYDVVAPFLNADGTWITGAHEAMALDALLAAVPQLANDTFIAMTAICAAKASGRTPTP